MSTYIHTLMLVTMLATTPAIAQEDLALSDEALFTDAAELHTDRLEAMLNFRPGSTRSTGVGGFYTVPITERLFGFYLDNPLVFEGGALIERIRWAEPFADTSCSSWYALTTMGGVHWSVYFVEEWAVFGKFRAGYSFGSGYNGTCTDTFFQPGTSGVAIDIGAGTLWQFSDQLGLRIDLGSHGISAGISTRL